MPRLKLTFLDDLVQKKERDMIEIILDEYGNEIYNYAKEYFNYIITTTILYDQVIEASLYIVIPEIGYDYKIISISYVDVENVTTKFFTLKTKQEEFDKISIKDGWNDVYRRITQLLNTNLVNMTLKFFVKQVELKRSISSQ